ncbi:MAG TPA: hypothetical protein VLH60_07085 [Sedimentisphaerales bacterium]|nr:hypothetical protein [Sedimentisphaerales bacterium]
MAGQPERRKVANMAVNSNCNYGVFWGETKENRAFDDRHASHYVKIMLDQLFGNQFLQIIGQRLYY